MLLFPEPPYGLLVAGLLASLACGFAFNSTLTQQVKLWSESHSTRILANLQGPSLLLPFMGISAGACVFLASGVEIFGFPHWFSYGLALPLTLLIASLVWTQLGRILVKLEQGGSQALDLDSIN